MTLPGKLWKLKKWVTVREAAMQLSTIFEEEVGEDGVLRLALDGHLKLSVNFVNHAYASIGHATPFEQAPMLVHYNKPNLISSKMANGKIISNPIMTVCIADGLPAEIQEGIDNESMYLTPIGLEYRNELIVFEKNIRILEGVFDLPMIGGERLDVEHQYQQLTGGPAVTLINIDGTYVESDDGKICRIAAPLLGYFLPNSGKKGNTANPHIKDSHEERQKSDLYDPNKFYPAGTLPSDSVLVVRVSALIDLQKWLNEEKEKETKGEVKEKDRIGSKERGTWLKIIYLMASQIADSKPDAYRKKDRSFNTSQFEKMLKKKATELEADGSILRSVYHGLSNDNLKKIIDEAKIYL